MEKKYNNSNNDKKRNLTIMSAVMDESRPFG